jgi:hypothetical protein
MKRSKGRVRQHIDKNPIEQLLGGFEQILGTSDQKEKTRKNQENLMVEGQEINLAGFKREEQEEKTPDIEAGIDYSREIVHVEEIAIKRENREVEMQLREIMVEIKKLTDSSKELQMQFKNVAVEQHATTPGKYHKNFFSWLLSMIKAARMKVEDSGAWLAAMHSKKKSREYGAMAKKQGTSFTLNNERTVATQVG